MTNKTRENLYPVKNIINHDYYADKLFDIAIIVLEEPLPMKKGVIEKIRLPKRSLFPPELPGIMFTPKTSLEQCYIHTVFTRI